MFENCFLIMLLIIFDFVRRGNIGCFQRRATVVIGLHWNPEALPFDEYLRAHVLKPMQNNYYDWMHCVLSDGLGGTNLVLIMKHLQVTHNVTFAHFANFAAKINTPKAVDHINLAHFQKDYFKFQDNALKGFASDHLSMIRVMALFLVDVISPNSHEHVNCFLYLALFLEICQLGPDKAPLHAGSMRRLIEMHHALYVRLYGTGCGVVKPKYHFIMHVPDCMESFGKLMSCYVGERKHKDPKRLAMRLFKGVEGTLIHELLNQQIGRFGEPGAWDENYVERVQELSVGPGLPSLYRATEVVNNMVTTTVGDIVYSIVDGRASVGKATAFWMFGELQTFEVLEYTATNDDTLWRHSHPRTRFYPLSAIVSPTAYYYKEPDLVRVTIPVEVRLAKLGLA